MPRVKGDTGSVATNTLSSSAAVWGTSADHVGVAGTSDKSTGAFGRSTNFPGVLGESDRHFGVEGVSFTTTGVYGESFGGDASGVEGVSPSGAGVAGFGTGAGVAGWSYEGPGVAGESHSGDAIVGVKSSDDGVAGSFTNVTFGGKFQAVTLNSAVRCYGHVDVVGNLSVSGSKSFRIDHPLDPANKFLYHAAVESPDMKNLYDGVAALDRKGEAIVRLPTWFGALNKELRYQITPIGSPAPNLHIAAEISDNRFRIAGGRPGMKVSWQVTGIRQDAWARTHPMPIEVRKSKQERGHYLHPELHRQARGKRLESVLSPELMRTLTSGKQIQKMQATRSEKGKRQTVQTLREARGFGAKTRRRSHQGRGFPQR